VGLKIHAHLVGPYCFPSIVEPSPETESILLPTGFLHTVGQGQAVRARNPVGANANALFIVSGRINNP